jgi:hypothetical protein
MRGGSKCRECSLAMMHELQDKPLYRKCKMHMVDRRQCGVCAFCSATGLLERDGKEISKTLPQKGRWHVHHWIRHFEPKLTISIPRVLSSDKTPSTRQQELVPCHDCVNLTHSTLITIFVLLPQAETLYKYVAQVHSFTRHKAKGLQLNQTVRTKKELQ